MARRDREFEYDDPLAEPGRWKRWLVRLGILVVLLVGLFFFLTSSFMVRRLVLPRINASLNGQLTVGEISLSPFSRLYLADVKISSADGKSVATAEEAEVRYGLVSLLRGRWLIPEIRLVKPQIQAVRRPDGTTTFDTLIKEDPSHRSQPTTLPDTLLIGRFVIADGAVDFEQILENGERTHLRLQGLNVELTNLGNSRRGELKLATALGLQRLATNGAPSGQIAFDLRGTSSVHLAKNLRLQALQTTAQLLTQQADGSYATLKGLNGRLEADFGGGNVRKGILRFERGGVSLGQLSLNGPVDLSRMTLRLRAELKALSHEILDLVGGPFGLSFGNARLDGDALVDISDHGQVINARTSLRASQLGIQTPRGSTPVLDLALTLDGRVQWSEQSADIRAFTLTATNQGRQLLRLHAPRTVNLLWNQMMRPSINRSELRVNLDRLDLGAWRPLLGPQAPAGRLSIQGVVTNQDDGRKIQAWFTNQIEGLTFRAGDYGLTNAMVRLETTILFQDFLALSAEEVKLDLAVDDSPLLALEGTASYEFGNEEWRGQFQATGDAAELVQHFPNPWVEASRGQLKMDGSLRFLGSARMISVSTILNEFTGRLERYHFDGQRLQAEVSVDWTPELISLRQVGLTSSRGTERSGSAFVGGLYRPGNGEGRFDLSLVNLNSAALGPFLATHLPDYEVTDGYLDGQVQLNITPTGRRDCTGAIETHRLAVRDRTSGRDHVPLDLKLELAAVENDGLIELLTNVVSLPATKRAANRIHATGRLSLSPTNREPAQLNIHADALDLSRVADFYRTNHPPATAPAAAPAPAQAPTGPTPSTNTNTTTIPDLVAGLTVDKLFIRQLEISDWKAAAVITNGLFNLRPCAMKVGGGQLSLEASRALADGKTALRLTAHHLPIEPITTAFLASPPGRYLGELSANVDYRSGQGADLADAATCSIALTNLTFRILPEWTRDLLAPAANLLHADQLLRSPLRHVGLRGALKGDTLDVQQFATAGDLFYLGTQGQITLAKNWIDSAVHLPITLALPRNLASTLGLNNLAPSSETGFVELPPFLTLEGTLGSRTNKVEAARLTGLLAGAIGRKLGGDAGGALEGIGNLLQGSGDAKSALEGLGNLLPSGNQPAQTPANASPNTATNAPPESGQPTQPAATNQTGQPALPFLPGLLNPPKNDSN